MATYAILSVIVVSLVSLIGVFTLSLKEERIRKYMFILVSLAVGALLGDAFIHIIPEAFEVSANATTTALCIIAGILIFFIIEKFLHWHHHGEDLEHDHVHPVGKLILISDGVHNLIDGIIIGAAYLVSIEVGVATTIAVILHEIPQEIGDFGVLLHAGYSKQKALWFNFLSALSAIVGVVIALVIGENSNVFINSILPIAAGGFIYIALSDLIPELNKIKSGKQSIYQILVVIIGVLAMVALVALE
jgi:zinc and cadmium transporter